jgi:hypothetical protein
MIIKNTILNGFGDYVNRIAPLIATFQACGRVNQAFEFPIKWNVYTAATSDIIEGTDITSFQHQKKVAAILPVVAKYIPIRLNAVMKAIAEAGGTYDSAMENQVKYTEDALKALETAFCGAAQDVGLQSIIDSTGTYAGINQAVVPSWSSAELSCVGASIYTQANSLFATLQAIGVGVNNLCIFAHPTAIRKFQQSAVAAGSLTVTSPPGGGPTDVGRFPHQALFNGVPIVAVNSLPEGDMYFIDMSDASIEMLKGPVVEDIGVSSLDSKFAVIIMGALKVTTRNRHGKLTGCDDSTAT